MVEDDETVADVLREVLSGEPFDLLFADTAEKAMAIVSENCPDLILTDISLPGKKTGLDVMRHARGLDPEVAVILMTGYASVQTAIDALRQGASDYFTKPFEEIGDIPKTVSRHLRNRRLKVENRALLDMLVPPAAVTLLSTTTDPKLQDQSREKPSVNPLYRNIDAA